VDGIGQRPDVAVGGIQPFESSPYASPVCRIQRRRLPPHSYIDASHRFTDPRHWFQLLIYSAFVESRKDAPVHELPLFHMKDLQRIDASRLADGMSK
jgi:hypothetical protein